MIPTEITKNKKQPLTQTKTQNKILNKLLSLDIIAPIILGIIVLLTWEISVRVMNIPPYLLPGPILVFQTMIQEWKSIICFSVNYYQNYSCCLSSSSSFRGVNFHVICSE